MKTFHFVAVQFALIRGCAAAYDRSITSQASPNNFILLEEQTQSLSMSWDNAIVVSSDVPVTTHPVDEHQAVILVTSDCDTSETMVVPRIMLGEEDGWVKSINITLDVPPEDISSMKYLQPSSYQMKSSHRGCTELYCAEKPWGPGPSSSAVASRSLLLSLLALGRSVFSNASGEKPRHRDLDTCTYNAEVFINGCEQGINVTAPNVRVVDALTEFADVVTEVDGMMSEFNESVTFTFPEDKVNFFVESGKVQLQLERDRSQCNCCMCIGRPYIDASGRMLHALPLAATNDDTCSWSASAAKDDNENDNESIDLAPSQNELHLGNEWTNNALGEHASVASFSAFSIALMTNEAPSDLVEGALKAGLDEIRHAKISFEIASKLIGNTIEPGPLPKSTHEFNHNLTELAMAVAKEGCIDETLSALIAVADAEAISQVLQTGGGDAKYLNVTDSTLIWIQDELSKIALDESNHSKLAWRTLEWVCSVDADADACSAANEGILDEKKLAVAFHQRFDRVDIDNEVLMKLRMAWKKIYTSYFHASITDNSVISSDTFEENSHLLESLVNNIVHR